MLLAGCTATVPVKQTFPPAPEALKAACSDLEIIDKPTVLLSELITVITRNYTKYHECAAQVEAWNEWYKSQKQVVDSVNK
jgi:hypothetical protein